MFYNKYRFYNKCLILLAAVMSFACSGTGNSEVKTPAHSEDIIKDKEKYNEKVIYSTCKLSNLPSYPVNGNIDTIEYKDYEVREGYISPEQDNIMVIKLWKEIFATNKVKEYIDKNSNTVFHYTSENLEAIKKTENGEVRKSCLIEYDEEGVVDKIMVEEPNRYRETYYPTYGKNSIDKLYNYKDLGSLKVMYQAKEALTFDDQFNDVETKTEFFSENENRTETIPAEFKIKYNNKNQIQEKQSKVNGTSIKYTYNDKGLFSEEIMYESNGAVSWHIKYEYEIDDHGNWTKMTKKRVDLKGYEDGTIRRIVYK